jgi:DNA-binding transcriptional LysR family regulator
MRSDLNDFVYFAEVVSHGGFAAAGRVLREPKSKLSRRVAGLEARLGVRLIERSSRRFRVTDVGQAFYERCRVMMSQAEQAEALVTDAQAEPNGLIRFSCPIGLVDMISGLTTSFLELYPRIKLQLVAVDRPVDLIVERIDLALRVRTSLDSDASLTMRSLGTSVRILVASPSLAQRITDIDSLRTVPILSTTDDADEVTWSLDAGDGRNTTLRLQPRLGCTDMAVVQAAALTGLGVALLPDHICRAALAGGQLVRVLSPWAGQKGIVHLVFTTRRGLPVAVRKLIDHLALHFPRDLELSGVPL